MMIVTKSVPFLHPLQSHAWGNFRKTQGQKVVRFDSFQVFFYSIPHLPYSIGYLPKGPLPTKSMIKKLKKMGKKYRAIFIKMEPNIKKTALSSKQTHQLENQFSLKKGRPLFTRYTLVLDLTKKEKELMDSFHSKTRYNIRLAKRKGVKIIEGQSMKDFEQYWQLMKETMKRQGFYAHDHSYHQKMWRIMHRAGIAHLLMAVYQKKVLAAWILFKFKHVLYYPYGASSSSHRNLMASNLIMWEAIRFGKKNDCQKFDLWGTPGPNPKKSDPWYGFHHFKMGYNPKIVEFIGTYDLVLHPILYLIYRLANGVRWQFLRLKTNFH